MKHLTKLFTLLIMAAMSMGVRAVSLPMNLGSYMPAADAVLSEGNNISTSETYRFGSIHSGATATFTLSNCEENMLLTFMTGTNNGQTPQVTVTMTDGGSFNYTTGAIDITHTGGYSLSTRHNYAISNIPSGTITLTFSFSAGGGYVCDLGNIGLYGASQYPWPSSSALNLQYGTYDRARWNESGEIDYIKAEGASIDNLMAYNSSESYYKFCFNISNLKQNSTVGVTITDMVTGTVEIDNQILEITSDGDKEMPLHNALSVGLKKIRLEFRDNDPLSDNSYLFNFKLVTIPAVAPLPMYGTSYLDLSKGTFGRTASAKYNHDPQYESGSQNIGYNGDGGYAEYYIGNTNPAGYYELHIGTSRYQDDASFTLTVTDVATSTIEVNQDFAVPSGSGYADVTCALYRTISTGLKKIRIETHSASNSHAFNYKHVCFRPIQELPMYGTSYLDLSRGTFGRTALAKYNSDPRYQEGDQNIGYNGDGGYAEYYIVNANPAGYYELHIGTSRYQDDASFTLTVTDVATSTIEVNQDFAVPSGSGYADVTCALYRTISTGLKKIRIETHSASNSHAFNYKHVCFRPIQELPMYGTSYLDLSRGTFGRTASAKHNSDPRYESKDQNIGYNGDGGYAEYYVENPENATYTFHIATRRYQESSFTLTITDMASGTEEINQDFDVANHSGYADQVCSLNNPLTTGVKKIRIETHSASDSYAFNYKEVAFGMTTYTRTHTHMNLNTLCYPYQIDSYTGATFYTMLYKVVENTEVTEVVLQEHVGALEAGKPYFYVPEGTELVCNYSGDYTAADNDGNGVYGSYTDNAVVTSGMYVTYNNQIVKAGDNVKIREYRAYINMDEVSLQSGANLVPGRRQLRIASAPQQTTGVENTSASAIHGGSKILRNGQLFIIRDGKTYDIFGRLVD